MIIMYLVNLTHTKSEAMACFTFITKNERVRMGHGIWIVIACMGHYEGMCHWPLSCWGWGSGCCLDWSYSAGSFLGGSTCEAVITCACGIISGMSGPTMSCWIWWWGYNVYPWGHGWRVPSLGFDTWHSPMPRGSAFELVPCENEP